MPDAKRTIKTDLSRDPAELRAAILSEHDDLRRLLRRVEDTAHQLAISAAPHALERVATVEAVRLLCTVMTAHIALEERALGPALDRLDAWGNVRAARLRSEHENQLRMLGSYVTALGYLSAAEPALLAQLARQLVETLRMDMEMEEHTLFSAELWRAEPASVDAEPG